jgi:hypothetical protein
MTRRRFAVYYSLTRTCHCTRPVPARVYFGEWICICGETIPGYIVDLLQRETTNLERENAR